MGDTMDLLAAKIEGKTKHLAEIAAEVAEKHEADAEVVCGHTYEVRLDLSQPAKEGGKTGDNKGSGASASASGSASASNDWTFVAVPVTSKVRALVDSWEASERVSGGLKEVKDVFNDKIRYELKDYKDVRRLLVDLSSVGDKWTTIARDTPANCAQVRLLLENMGVLEEALGELHVLTMDARDPMAGEEEGAVRSSLDTIAREWRRVEELVPKSEGGKLAASVVGVSGSAAIVRAPFDQVHPELKVDGRSISHTKSGYRPFFGPVLRSGTHSYRFKIAGLSKTDTNREFWGVCAENSIEQAMEHRACYNFLHGFDNSAYQFNGGETSSSNTSDVAWVCQVGHVVDITIDCDEKILTYAVTDSGGSTHSQTQHNNSQSDDVGNLLAAQGGQGMGQVISLTDLLNSAKQHQAQQPPPQHQQTSVGTAAAAASVGSPGSSGANSLTARLAALGSPGGLKQGGQGGSSLQQLSSPAPLQQQHQQLQQTTQQIYQHGPWKIPDIPVPCSFMGILYTVGDQLEFME